MASNVRSIELKCPVCESTNSINIPEVVLSQKKFGTIKVQIPPGAVCEHQFIVFVDNKGIVRSYEKIDIQMQLPSEETAKEKAGVLTLRKLIRLFGTVGILSLIHSKVFGYPTFIVAEENFEVNDELLNLVGDRMLPEEYQGFKTIHLLKESDYGQIMKQIKVGKDTFLMDSKHNILQTPWDEKLKWEEEMIKKALEIIDEEEQLFLIQYDISKFVKEAEETKKILELHDEISEKDLKKKLMSSLNTAKISTLRFKLIKEFIERRFSPNLFLKIK